MYGAPDAQETWRDCAVSVILVVDEHSVYRNGLRDVIETRIDRSRVVEASSIDVVDGNHVFDLVLIDAGSLTQRTLGALKQIHEVSPETRFAVMSTSNTRADVLNCLSAGFHGFVYKLQSDSELITALNDLLSGRIYVPRWLADGDDGKTEIPPSVNVRTEGLRLTPRQNEILPLLAQGMSNKEIARHLKIAEGTTKIHTAALLRALGARNRTEAAFMAAKLVGASNRFESRFGRKFVIDGLGGPRPRA
jgi:DNA-binding NarL/FixJ family response regulator